MESVLNLVPGVIRSYDPDSRRCRVELPGLTDGADVFPEAELCLPLGDKSEHTELRILEGDKVWLAFQGGDPRYPVIMGYRPRHTGNALAIRRWHHDNFQLEADETFVIEAKTSITLKVGGSVVALTAAGVLIDGKRVDLAP